MRLRIRRILQVVQLEDRCVPAVSFRPIDEAGNNLTNPVLGTANTDLLRVSPAAYADGISSLSLSKRPSARVVSDILNSQTDPANSTQEIQTLDQNSLSDFGYAWGSSSTTTWI